ncbi:MAG: zinc ABC transporter substrate-binding protein [Oscillospiraceae bacterium]|nr:zinc ABC transporter substrate-binding protein [Oscillospiraceae bacterium]
MNLLKRRLPCLVVAAITLFTATACAPARNISDTGLNVTVTTTMLLDLTRQIGGDCVNVHGLMGSGVDPHQYRASAGDVIKMQQADVVIYSGLHLEGKMGEVLSSLESYGKTVICAADGIDEELLIQRDGVYDPHIWFDVTLWQKAAEEVARGLSAADPANAETYGKNLASYTERLEELERYIGAKTSELDGEQRVLITAHDAFGYFGRAYGFTVMGLQGVSTAAEAGTSDVSRLAAFIAENRIHAVFIETSLPVKSIEALQEAVRSKGFETRLGGALYSDSLGDGRSGEDSYIAAFKHNIDVMVDGLKGE